MSYGESIKELREQYLAGKCTAYYLMDVLEDRDDEISRLQSANRDLYDRFDDARATAEQAQARVAELEEKLKQAEKKAALFLKACEDLLDERGTEKALILHKQAEAVDEAIVYALRAVGNVDPFEVDIHKFANDYAQRLRQQADELGGVGRE